MRGAISGTLKKKSGLAAVAARVGLSHLGRVMFLHERRGEFVRGVHAHPVQRLQVEREEQAIP